MDFPPSSFLALSGGAFVDDQLKLARARIDRQIVDGEDLEANVLHPLTRQDLAQAIGHGLDRRRALLRVERRVEANHEPESLVAEQVHLEARDARDEDFVDRVRADEVFAAVARLEYGLQLVPADEAFDHEIRR